GSSLRRPASASSPPGPRTDRIEQANARARTRQTGGRNQMASRHVAPPHGNGNRGPLAAVTGAGAANALLEAATNDRHDRMTWVEALAASGETVTKALLPRASRGRLHVMRRHEQVVSIAHEPGGEPHVE